MSNRCWCDVDPTAFQHNIAQLKKAAQNKPLIAVVKAYAYGHWAREAVKHMPGADRFAVATINEAMELLDHLQKPVLILSPLTENEDVVAAVANGLEMNIGSSESLQTAIRVARSLQQKAVVHMELDTGMSRTGFDPEEFPGALARVIDARELELVGVFTHFQSGCDREAVFEQMHIFHKLTESLPRGVVRHAASTSALLAFPETHLDAVRPGLGVYGALPEPDCSVDLSLKPALSLKARVVQIRQLRRGSSVSYGARFVAGKKTRVAVLGVGYADGFPPVLANRGRVLINGKPRRVLGAVCMDAIMVDASEKPLPQVGDVAVIIGRDGDQRITAEQLAQQAGTTPYDILTGIGRRAKRIYRTS